jgi:hypothetical protein
VESAANEKIGQGRLRQHFLDDFHNCLENPAGFSTATTGPAAVPLTMEPKTTTDRHLHKILDASVEW